MFFIRAKSRNFSDFGQVRSLQAPHFLPQKVPSIRFAESQLFPISELRGITGFSRCPLFQKHSSFPFWRMLKHRFLPFSVFRKHRQAAEKPLSSALFRFAPSPSNICVERVESVWNAGRILEKYRKNHSKNVSISYRFCRFSKPFASNILGHFHGIQEVSGSIPLISTKAR